MQLKQQSVNTGARINYENYSDFLADAIDVDFDAKRKTRCSQNTGKDEAEFRGTNTFADAVQLARGGWDDGTKLVAAMATTMTSEITGHIVEQTMYLDTTPQYCWDMASAVAGVPQCGVNFAPDQEKPLVRIAVNLSASAHISSDTLFLRAATIAALAECLEFAGMDTEIVIGGAQQERHLKLQVLITIKHAGQSIDTSVLAFALGHPSMVRRIVRAWEEKFYDNTLYDAFIANAHYGHPIPLVLDSNEYIHIGPETLWTSATKSMEWIKTTLRQYGVHLAD